MSEEKKYVTYGDDVRMVMDAELFKDLFELMTALIKDEVQLQITANGVVLRQLEESHIALTDMFVPKEYFKELKQGQKIKELRLEVDSIKSVLTKLSHGDEIDFTVSDEGKLHVEIKGKRIRVFELPLLEAEAIERRIPKVICNVRAKVCMEGLLYGVEDAQRFVVKSGGKKKELFGQIMIKTEPMGLRIEAETEDGLYSTGATLTSGWDIMKFEGSVGQSVVIAITYLVDIIRALSKVTNMVQIEFSQNVPLHIIAELPFKGMNLEYWVAPRILEKGGEKK
jgi:ASC-1-like (ASCH) protein